MWPVGETTECVQDIFNHVLANLEDLMGRLLDAANLEEAFHPLVSDPTSTLSTLRAW